VGEADKAGEAAGRATEFYDNGKTAVSEA